MDNRSFLNQVDPVHTREDHGLEDQNGQTPFNPPDAFDQQLQGPLSAEETPSFIHQLMEEHRFAMSQADLLEGALVDFRNAGFRLSEQGGQIFSHFFKYFDQEILTHNEKEDRLLFPLLEERLLDSGEHSTAEHPTTAIDVMQDDHVRFIQLGTLTFNLLGIASRIRDEVSRVFICEQAYQSGRELTELLKLHIFREDHTLFPLAVKLIARDEFDLMARKSLKYETPLSNPQAEAL